MFLFEAGERPYEKKLTISYGLLSPDKTYLVSNVRLGHVALQTTKIGRIQIRFVSHDHA